MHGIVSLVRHVQTKYYLSHKQSNLHLSVALPKAFNLKFYKMKKILIHFKFPFLLMLLSICSISNAQTHTNTETTDDNPIYLFEGAGFEESETGRRMNFSTSTVKGNNTNEVSMNNNEFTVKKDGIYRISVSSDINKGLEKEKQVYYLINLNSKQAFHSEEGILSPEGIYSFQIQLKKDDVLGFEIANDQAINNKWKNNLSIRFSDPNLIKLSEHNH